MTTYRSLPTSHRRPSGVRMSSLTTTIVIPLVAMLIAATPARSAQEEIELAEFPKVEEVTGDPSDGFGGDASRAADLEIVYGVFEDRLGQRYFRNEMTQAEFARYKSYRDTVAGLYAKYRDQNRMLEFGHAVSRRKADEEQIVAKYFPGGRKDHPDSAGRKVRELLAQQAKQSAAMRRIVLAVAGLLAWSTFLALRRRNLRSDASSGGGTLREIPPAIELVSVPGMRYSLSFETGKVIDERSWSETHVHGTITGGGSGPGSRPASGIIHSTTSRHGRTWLVNADGREIRWNVNARLMDAYRPGHILTAFFQSTSSFLGVYNHSTGELLVFDGALKEVHSKGRELTWLPTLPAALVACWIALPVEDLPQVAVGTALFAVPALVVALSLSAIQTARRNRAFKKRYVPSLRQFLEERTPVVARAFAGHGVENAAAF